MFRLAALNLGLCSLFLPVSVGDQTNGRLICTFLFTLDFVFPYSCFCLVIFSLFSCIWNHSAHVIQVSGLIFGV